MRKVFVMLAVCITVFACGGSNEIKPAEETKTAETKTADPDLEKGLELIGASDCTTCHKINEDNIGPAYDKVAQKYEATPAVIDTLATKIIKGGSGVWGQVPMTEHPTLSMDEARLMVKYILSLKK